VVAVLTIALVLFCHRIISISILDRGQFKRVALRSYETISSIKHRPTKHHIHVEKGQKGSPSSRSRKGSALGIWSTIDLKSSTSLIRAGMVPLPGTGCSS